MGKATVRIWYDGPPEERANTVTAAISEYLEGVMDAENLKKESPAVGRPDVGTGGLWAGLPEGKEWGPMPKMQQDNNSLPGDGCGEVAAERVVQRGVVYVREDVVDREKRRAYGLGRDDGLNGVPASLTPDCETTTQPQQDESANPASRHRVEVETGRNMEGRTNAPRGGKASPLSITTCPNCGGPADNGNDRCVPPSPYYCTKCAGNDQQETDDA